MTAFEGEKHGIVAVVGIGEIDRRGFLSLADFYWNGLAGMAMEGAGVA